MLEAIVEDVSYKSSSESLYRTRDNVSQAAIV